MFHYWTVFTMINLAIALFFLFPGVAFSTSHQNLSVNYDFSVTLKEGKFWLYWSFNKTTQNISFAVRARTTGWVGFALSPDGHMPGSDIVMGWIDNSGMHHFYDYYAVAETTPIMDSVQNWFLTNAEEEDGFMVLEFYRNFTSCDKPHDLDLLGEPMQVMYAWHDTKPQLTNPPNGYAYTQHLVTTRGHTAINMIGRFNPPDMSTNGEVVFVGVENATITASDSYWCKATRLPDSINQNSKYITKFGGRVSSGNEGNIIRMIVQVCTGLNDADLEEEGRSCDDVSSQFASCLNQDVIGVWGRGGEDFVYPDNVAYKFGGTDDPLFAVIRIKYSLPNGVTALSDSSGIEFTYTSTARRYNAGILYLGHTLYHNMVIPPGAVDYSVLGLCSGTCTKNNIPPGGINIFANIFAGSGLERYTQLELSHTRDVSCSGNSVSTELKPLDRSLFFGIDKQWANYFLESINVQPGDSLILTCNYTSTKSGVILGGAGPSDESCLSFSVYYPYIDMTACTSYPDFDKFNEFIDSYVPTSSQAAFRSLILNPRSSQANSSSQVAATMNGIEWTAERIDAYKNLVYNNGRQWSMCEFDKERGFPTDLPDSSCCGYEPDSVCTAHTSTPCCQRQCAMRENGAGMISVRVIIFSFAALLTLLV